MLTTKKIHLALLLLIAAFCLTAAAPAAKAEHIFFQTRINRVTLDEGGSDLRSGFNSSSLFVSPQNGGVNTIILPNGFLFLDLTCFNLASFGEGGVGGLSFVADEGSELESPNPVGFEYDGEATRSNPQVFRFGAQQLPFGVFTGTLYLNYLSTEGKTAGEDEVIFYRVVLISQPVPEPATMVLLGTGLAGVAAGIRRRKKSSK